MKNISLIKKIKLFREFKKIINLNKFELEQKFNIRIDMAKRLYTVVNVPQENIGEAYSLKKSDIDKISESYIKGYASDLGKFLDSKGLSEMYELYKIEKIEKYSYLIVFGYSFFKSNEYYNNIYYKIIPTLSVLTFIVYLLLRK